MDQALDSGDCFDEDLNSIFPRGSLCRRCLDGGSSFEACVEADDCETEDQLVFWWNLDDEGNGFLVETWQTYWAACAPNRYLFAMLVSQQDRSPRHPPAFEHDRWTGFCTPMWDPEISDAYYYCWGDVEDDRSHTLAEGVPGRLQYIRPKGSDGEPWNDRLTFLNAIEIPSNGARFDHFWAGNPGSGVVSAPWRHYDSNGDGEIGLGDEDWGSSYGGWGVNPNALRPGNDNPHDPEQTMARDWVAAITLKASTARDGVLISFSNHSRCAEDAWRGPDALGRYQCTQAELPHEGWINDGMSHWTYAGSGQSLTMPMLTMGSTGLPDPDVPGGAVVHLAVTPAFESYEQCDVPHTLQPDLIPYADVPDTYPDHQGALWGHTYRFGKDEDQDIRFVMGSNWHRGYCPADGG